LWNRIERIRGQAIATTVFGAKMRCDPKDIIQATILHFGVWEPEITEIVASIVRRGDIAVDIGANVGYYSLLFSKLGAKPIAIEPHPRLAHEIEENDRLNAFNIRIEAVAVTERQGTVQLYEAPRTNVGMSTLMPGRFTKSIDVPGATLIDILKPFDLKRISLFKIDIEGSEAPVMSEIAANLPLFSDRLAICVEAGSDWSDAFDFLQAQGFSAWRIPTDLGTLWTRLLNDEPADKPVRIDSFPRESCDLLLMREDSR
jgi:FkbM family methyltransferase